VKIAHKPSSLITIIPAKPNQQGKDAFGKEKFNTYTSYTVLVQGNDFVVENLTIQNSSGRIGQAVALHIEGDQV